MLNFPGVSLCPSQHHQSALPAIRHPALLIISLLPRASNHRCPEPRNLYTPSLPLTRSRNNTTEILRNNLKTSQRVSWFYNGCLNQVLQKKILNSLLHSLTVRLQMISCLSENLYFNAAALRFDLYFTCLTKFMTYRPQGIFAASVQWSYSACRFTSEDFTPDMSWNDS